VQLQILPILEDSARVTEVPELPSSIGSLPTVTRPLTRLPSIEYNPTALPQDPTPTNLDWPSEGVGRYDLFRAQDERRRWFPQPKDDGPALRRLHSVAFPPESKRLAPETAYPASVDDNVSSKKIRAAGMGDSSPDLTPTLQSEGDSEVPAEYAGLQDDISQFTQHQQVGTFLPSSCFYSVTRGHRT
jgi:hypothetical protein